MCAEICLTGGVAAAKSSFGPVASGCRNKPGLNLGLAERRIRLVATNMGSNLWLGRA